MPADLDAEGLRTLLSERPSGVCRDPLRAALGFAAMHQQLRRRESLTLRRLWRDYREAHPDWYGYSQYCELHRDWTARRSPVVLQAHMAGLNLFVD